MIYQITITLHLLYFHRIGKKIKAHFIKTRFQNILDFIDYNQHEFLSEIAKLSFESVVALLSHHRQSKLSHFVEK